MAGKTRASVFGNVEKRISKRGQTRFRASFPNPEYGNHPSEKQRISKTFERKSAASAWLAQQQAAIEQGTWLSPLQEEQRLAAEAERARVEGYTFGQYGEEYLAVAHLKPEPRRKYLSTWHTHVEPYWGGKPILAITTRDITVWLQDGKRWTRTLKSGEVRRIDGARKKAFELLRLILNGAVADGLLESNPCTRKHASYVNTIRHSQRHEPRALEPSEVWALAGEVPETLKTMVLLMAFNGLRLGEARELRLSDVDFDSGSISVTRAVAGHGKNLAVGTPKTRGAVRTVYLDEVMLGELRAHIAGLPMRGRDALVFPSPLDGRKHRDEDGIRDALANAAVRLGLGVVTAHDLRHTFATLAGRVEGVSIRDLQEALGHSTPAMSIRYMKTSDEQQRKLAKGVGGALAGTSMVVSLDARRTGTA